MEERRADRFEITLKDVYDVANKTEATVQRLVSATENIVEDDKDHEARLRLLESMRWKTTAALTIAGVAGSIVTVNTVKLWISGG
jgi:outer membrane lipopolysaccharide assembly protein LptE/RlpB